MKRLAATLICLMFIMLCGCNNKSSKVTVVTTGLSFTAESEIEGCVFKYLVCIEKQGNIRIEVEEPENIKGTVVEFLNNNVKITYNGLEYNTDIMTLPTGTVMDFIYNVFSDDALIKREIIFENDEICISGKNRGYNYKLFLGQTGLPVKVTDKSGIEVIIKNATLLDNNLN